LIRCEPAILEVEDGQIGMREPVEASVPQVIELIKTLIKDLLQEKPKKEVETT
jgi:hypothetical protein